MQKKHDEESSYFQAFDDYSKAQATMDKYRDMFSAHFKGGKMSDSMWEQVKKGDLSHVSKHTDSYDKVKELYESHASGMFETQREMDMGLQKIQNLYKLGDDTREFAEQFSDFLEEDEKTGNLKVKSKEVNAFITAIEKVRTDLNKTTEELKATKKQIKEDKVKDVGKAEIGVLGEDELNTIGRNLKK